MSRPQALSIGSLEVTAYRVAGRLRSKGSDCLPAGAQEAARRRHHLGGRPGASAGYDRARATEDTCPAALWSNTSRVVAGKEHSLTALPPLPLASCSSSVTSPPMIKVELFPDSGAASRALLELGRGNSTGHAQGCLSAQGTRSRGPDRRSCASSGGR